MTTRCKRSGCGRPLTAAASVAAGMGKRCQRLERELDRARAEAVSAAAVPFGKLAVPAGHLIEAGKLTLIRPNVWSAESSDGKREYTCTAFSCECKAAGFGNLCTHRCAAAMASAYLEVA